MEHLSEQATTHKELVSLKSPSNAKLVEAVASKVFPELAPKVSELVSSYPGLEHRLETVSLKPHIINDSKATNVDATCFALSSMSQPVTLLFGGTPKKGDDVKKLTKHHPKIKNIVLFGPLGAQSLDPLKELSVPIRFFSTLKEALLQKNQKLWREGDNTILFSPGGSSFDEFSSFEARGLLFKEGICC